MTEPTLTPDPEQAAELDEAASRVLNVRDQAPSFMLRTQAWFHSWLSNESRIVLGVVVVVMAIVAVAVLSSFRIVRILFDALDIVAFLGLFLVNWLGNGGALVPIPGARFIGLLLVFQQAVLLPSWEVFAVAGAAMALGLLSYYIAGARTAESYGEGDTEAAEKLATQTGMLDEQQPDFSPGADLDEQMVSALAGVEIAKEDESVSAEAGSTSAQGEPTTRRGRVRRRFSRSLKRTQERAQPVIEQRGTYGMFLLCFAPSPMGTAAAYLGGLMHFGFVRYLLASFAAKYLLTGIIVLLALVFSDAARAVDIPELTIPIVDITLFEDGPPTLPGAASPSPSAEPLD